MREAVAGHLWCLAGNVTHQCFTQHNLLQVCMQTLPTPTHSIWVHALLMLRGEVRGCEGPVVNMPWALLRMPGAWGATCMTQGHLKVTMQTNRGTCLRVCVFVCLFGLTLFRYNTVSIYISSTIKMQIFMALVHFCVAFKPPTTSWHIFASICLAKNPSNAF